LKYKSEVEKWCPKDMNGYLDVSSYVNVILAIMMVESGGEGNDPMQSSECSKNTKYSKKPNSIKDPKYSIECGVKDF
ncbi:lysozyme family protein, partial [Klebsiella pneumoniae]